MAGPDVLQPLQYGCPASTLTDNGMVYTVRHASTHVRGGRNAFEAELAALGVRQKNSRPNHPTTCGKVERFQQTTKVWLARQPHQPETLDELNTDLETFRHAYNHHRPHRSLGRRTPAAAYTARPKAGPTGEPMPASAPTRSTTARSPCATPAPCTPSASDVPTTAARSPPSSTTCTSPSSTEQPAKSSENSPSTPPADTSPRTARSPNPEGSGLADVLRHHNGGGGGI